MILTAACPAWDQLLVQPGQGCLADKLGRSCATSKIPGSASATSMGDSRISFSQDTKVDGPDAKQSVAPVTVQRPSIAIRPGFVWSGSSQGLQSLPDCSTLPADDTLGQADAFAQTSGSDSNGHTFIGIFEGSNRLGSALAVAAARHCQQFSASSTGFMSPERSLSNACSSLHAALLQQGDQDPQGVHAALPDAALALVQHGRVAWCCSGRSAGVVGASTSGTILVRSLPGSCCTHCESQETASLTASGAQNSLRHTAAFPKMHTAALGGSDKYLVIASQGLWQVMTGDDVVQFVDRYCESPMEHVSAAAALTLQAQQLWKSAALSTQVPSVSAVVLELCPGPSAQIVPRCCPPNYPICGSTNAEAQASASQAAQKSFARLSPAHFKLLQEGPATRSQTKLASSTQEPKPPMGQATRSRTPSPQRGSGKPSAATSAASPADDAASLAEDGRLPSLQSWIRQLPVASPSASPSRAVNVPALPEEEMHFKPPLGNSSALYYPRTAGHGDTSGDSMSAPTHTDLCLARYSIPETEPVGVPRVRSTTAISSMLLPVCKAYPSQEGLARSSSDTTDASLIRAESWLPVGSLSSGSAASPPSLSSVQAHEQLQQGSKSNWTGTNAKPPSSLKAEDERRVHGRGSHSNPTLAQFLIADTNDPMEEHKRCQVLLDAPAPELAPTSTPGEKHHQSLLRRSLSHLSERMPPSPFLWLRSSEAPAAAGINPWSDEEDISAGSHCSSGKDTSTGRASRDGSLTAGSSKLRGGSSALLALRSSSSFPRSSSCRGSGGGSTAELSQLGECSKRRGGSAALLALHSSSDSAASIQPSAASRCSSSELPGASQGVSEGAGLVNVVDSSGVVEATLSFRQ